MANSARLDELRKKFDENPRRYFAPLANELRKQGDVTQAIALCRTHLPNQPGHISGHIVLAQALYEAREHVESRESFELALDLDPENLIALRYLGDIARVQGAVSVARGWYERVLEVDPRNEEIAALLNGLEAASDAAVAPAQPTPGAPASALAVEDLRRAFQPRVDAAPYTAPGSPLDAAAPHDAPQAGSVGDGSEDAVPPPVAEGGRHAGFDTGSGLRFPDADEIAGSPEPQAMESRPHDGEPAEGPQPSFENWLDEAPGDAPDRDDTPPVDVEENFFASLASPPAAQSVPEIDAGEPASDAAPDALFEFFLEEEPEAEAASAAEASATEEEVDHQHDGSASRMVVESPEGPSAVTSWEGESDAGSSVEPAGPSEARGAAEAKAVTDEPYRGDFTLVPQAQVYTWDDDLQDEVPVPVDEATAGLESPAPADVVQRDESSHDGVPDQVSSSAAEFALPESDPASMPEFDSAAPTGASPSITPVEPMSIFGAGPSTGPGEVEAFAEWPSEDEVAASESTTDSPTARQLTDSPPAGSAGPDEIEFFAAADEGPASRLDVESPATEGAWAEAPREEVGTGMSIDFGMPWDAEPPGVSSDAAAASAADVAGEVEAWETSPEPGAESPPWAAWQTFPERAQAPEAQPQADASVPVQGEDARPDAFSEAWAADDRIVDEPAALAEVDEARAAAPDVWGSAGDLEPDPDAGAETPLETASAEAAAWDLALAPEQLDVEHYATEFEDVNAEALAESHREFDATDTWDDAAPEEANEAPQAPGPGLELGDSTPERPAAPFVTETMAELYLQQGFTAEALDVYRQLLERQPDDRALRDRIAALEQAPVLAQAPEATEAHAGETAVVAQPAESARAFFGRFARRVPGIAGQGTNYDAGVAFDAREPSHDTGSPSAADAGWPRIGGAAHSEEGLTQPDRAGETLASLFAMGPASEHDERAADDLASAYSGPAPEAPGELSLERLFGDVPARSPDAVTSRETIFANAPTPADPMRMVGEAVRGERDIEQFTAWLEGLRKK